MSITDLILFLAARNLQERDLVNNNNKKTVLITGGARRVGAVIAEHLAAEGWDIVIHYNRSLDKAHALCLRLEDTYSIKACSVCGDFSKEFAAGKVLESTIAQAGRIDALINNAAIYSIKSLKDATTGDWDIFSQVNTRAPIQLTELFAAHLKGLKRPGAVVNILDQRIINPKCETTPYLVSKRELASFTLCAATDFAPDIRVNAVAPGSVLTAELAVEKEPAGEFLLSHRPKPQCVAEAVSYLLTAKSVTGQTIFTDSGQHLL